MKRVRILILVIPLLLLNSCDMFRKIAGRPTSADIRIKRTEITVTQQRHDSLEARMARTRAYYARRDSIRQLNLDIRYLDQVGVLYTETLGSRYYVVVGSFKQISNAEAMIRRVSDAGYIPTKIVFKNGFTAVGMCPTNNLTDAYYSMKGVKREDFCPDDVWILYNKVK